MKTSLLNRASLGFLFLIAVVHPLVAAELFQPVTVADPSLAAPAGGGGGSWAPILTPDGRYVLFAGTANNLVLPTNNTPIPAPFPPKINVFLRDRLLGTTTLVSVNRSGVQGGNGDSLPLALSTNGLVALFESEASDLVPDDTNNAGDVFVRDLGADTTRLVSVNTNGVPGNGESRTAVMTPDGHYVAFVSAATDLVPGDTNGIADVFVRDVQAGTTVLASPGAQATASAYGGTSSSDNPQITPDGHYVAFSSSATNLVPGVSTTGDIYVRDLSLGVTYWASADARSALQAAQGTTAAICYSAVISADGQLVAYQASELPGGTLPAGLILRYHLAGGTTDLVATNASVPEVAYNELQELDMTADGGLIAYVAETNGSSTTCIYLWDAQQGSASLASGNLTNGVPPFSNCHSPVLDTDGHWLAFFSSAPGMVTNGLTGDYHLCLRDLRAGTIALLDQDPNGIGLPLNSPTVPCLSADARYVAFECVDAGFLTNTFSHDSDIFVRDLQAGTLELVSARAVALPSLSPNGRSGFGAFSASADARYVAFASEADNLVPNDTNGWRDVFVRDLVTGGTLLVSVNTNGVAADRGSTEPALSTNGQYVAFTSGADDLVAGDTNNALDVFLRDLQAGTTTLVSADASGLHSGNGDSYGPALSGDGRYVLFRSKATNLTGAGGVSGENLFVRDLWTGTNYVLTANPTNILGAAMTPNGQFVAFAVSGASAYWSVWDTQSARGLSTNVVSGLTRGIGISSDGTRVAYTTGSGVFVADIAANTNYGVSTNAAAAAPGLRFSADGRWLAYAAQVSKTNQVFLYDCVGASNLLVSQSYDLAGVAYGNSDSPEISGDARFVAYRSDAPNLVPGDTNDVRGVFLYDRSSAATLLVTVSRYGPFAADGRSLFPFFSSDGQMLLLQTWASDIEAGDFNHTEDILAYSIYPGSIPLFYARVIPGATPSSSPTIMWPVVAGKTYYVEFKDSLDQANWQRTSNGITLQGTQGYFLDPAPAATRRFYRIVAY